MICKIIMSHKRLEKAVPEPRVQGAGRRQRSKINWTGKVMTRMSLKSFMMWRFCMLPTHLYVFVYAHLCAYPCGGPWWTLEDPPQLCLFCLLKQGLSLGWSRPHRLDWPASEFPRSACLCLPIAGIVSATTQGFLTWVWASDSGAHACTVSPSLTESWPQSNYLPFLVDLCYFFHINRVCVTWHMHRVTWSFPRCFSLAITSKQFSCVCIFMSFSVGYVSHGYSIREITAPLLLG